MQDHLEISDLGATFEITDEEQDVRLVIHRLEARLRRSGLNLLVTHLIPDVDVAVHPEEPEGESGVDLVVQATQWGLRPRIRVQIRLDGRSPSALRINIEAATSWSPLDWTMLRIVRDKLYQASQQRTELTREGPETYCADVHQLIADLIAERGGPVRWNARLSAIESTREDMIVRFTSNSVSRPEDS